MKFKTMWQTAAVIGAAAAWPVAHFSDRMPWLIAVPIVGGAVIIAAMELIPAPTKKQGGGT